MVHKLLSQIERIIQISREMTELQVLDGNKTFVSALSTDHFVGIFICYVALFN